MLLGFDFFDKYVLISFTKNTFKLTIKGNVLSYPYFPVNNHVSFLRKATQSKISSLSLEQRRESAKEKIIKRKNEIDQLRISIEKDYYSEYPQAFWNKDYYEVSLPLKDEKVRVPMKANYVAMSTEDRKVIQQEIKELLNKKLIIKFSSNWACATFYVEKHLEIFKGKKGLVINYKCLKKALKDIRHPIPHKVDLIRRLKDCIMFSKFDLKSGFWQLEITEKDRHKIDFVVPILDCHYEWNVMPFGLKNAPSEF